MQGVEEANYGNFGSVIVWLDCNDEERGSGKAAFDVMQDQIVDVCLRGENIREKLR